MERKRRERVRGKTEMEKRVMSGVSKKKRGEKEYIERTKRRVGRRE